MYIYKIYIRCINLFLYQYKNDNDNKNNVINK